MEKSLVLQNFVGIPIPLFFIGVFTLFPPYFYLEPPLNFRPTYKLDVGTDNTYDTGPKNRIPAWTDRILYVEAACLQCLAYNADFSINTSDHKPVYATFAVDVEMNDSEKRPPQQHQTQLKPSTTMSSSFFASNNRIAADTNDSGNANNILMEPPLSHPPFSSESQVCRIM